MNTTILPTLLGSMLAMAPIVDSTFQFSSELKRPVLSDSSLVAHEWGTFTALQGSNGVPVNGMQHEEESLPSFVHSRDPLGEGHFVTPPVSGGGDSPDPFDPPIGRCHGFCKGFEPNSLFNESTSTNHINVTQKMETPVLYFYSKNKIQNAVINIDFPKGIISQYYPAPDYFLPRINEVRSLQDGHVGFLFDVMAEDQVLTVSKVSSESIYAPSRDVASNFIKTKSNENEKLIFYRGLGDFSTNISVRSDRDGVEIKNNSFDLPMPAGILLYSNGGVSGGFVEVGEISPQHSIKFNYQQIVDLQNSLSPGMLREASMKLVSLLEQSGLFHDEAVAIVNTWKKSYFKTQGLRFLHILPRAETEKILPLSMSPTPTELVRTLVGRIEIMTYQDEQNLISQIAEQGEGFQVDSLGRLAEAKLRRVQELVPVDFKTDIQKLIDKAVLH